MQMLIQKLHLKKPKKCKKKSENKFISETRVCPTYKY